MASIKIVATFHPKHYLIEFAKSCVIGDILFLTLILHAACFKGYGNFFSLGMNVMQ